MFLRSLSFSKEDGKFIIIHQFGTFNQKYFIIQNSIVTLKLAKYYTQKIEIIDLFKKLVAVCSGDGWGIQNQKMYWQITLKIQCTVLFKLLKV